MLVPSKRRKTNANVSFSYCVLFLPLCISGVEIIQILHVGWVLFFSSSVARLDLFLVLIKWTETYFFPNNAFQQTLSLSPCFSGVAEIDLEFHSQPWSWKISHKQISWTIAVVVEFLLVIYREPWPLLGWVWRWSCAVAHWFHFSHLNNGPTKTYPASLWRIEKLS